MVFSQLPEAIVLPLGLKLTLATPPVCSFEEYEAFYPEKTSHKPNSLILASCCQSFAIRAETDTCDNVNVPLDSKHFPRSDLPQPNCRILTSRYEVLPSGLKRYTSHLIGMPIEGFDYIPGKDVPQ